VWFTDRCENGRAFWIAFATTISFTAIVMRQLLGVEEIDTAGVVVGTLLSVGLLYLVFVSFLKEYTAGCYALNGWWLMLSILACSASVIINVVVGRLTSAALMPFLFVYPAIAIKADGKKAAYAGIFVNVAFITLALFCLSIAHVGGWWYYGVVFSGDWLHRLYQFIVGGVVLSTALASTISLMPIRVAGFALPGYWTWRYADTLAATIIILVIDFALLTYGGLLQTVVNVAYGKQWVV